MCLYLLGCLCVCGCLCACIIVPVNSCRDNKGLHLFNGRKFSAGMQYINCLLFGALSLFCRAHHSRLFSLRKKGVRLMRLLNCNISFFQVRYYAL